MANPTLKSIKVALGGHTYRSSQTETEAHIKYIVIYESNNGVDRYVQGNGIAIAYEALRSWLGWTAFTAPCYPGREWIDYSYDDLMDPDVMGQFSIYIDTQNPMYATEISGTQEGDEPVYHFDVTYKTGVRANWDTGQSISLPWFQPCQITWSTRPVSEALDKDIYGHPILNSAGEFFSPPLEKQIFHPVCTIVRNEYSNVANVIPYNIEYYLNTINNAPITIAGAYILLGGAKITNMSATRKDFYNIPYYECTYEFEIKPDSWMERVLDQGANYLKWDSVLGKYVLDHFEVAGEADDKPNLLDGYGGRLIPAGELNVNGIAYYRWFETYNLTNFAALALPTNMNSIGY